MMKRMPIVIAVLALSVAASSAGQAQEPSAADREQALEQARTRLQAARRELDEAAREVAELSGGPTVSMAPFVRYAGPAEMAGTNTMLWVGRGAQLGVSIEPAPDAAGVRVLAVSPNGPAAKAGVESGDIITKVDGVTLAGTKSAPELLVTHMGDVEPGQSVALGITRAGQAREISVEAGDPAAPFVFMNGPRSGSVVAVAPGGRGGPGTFVLGDRFDGFLNTRFADLELVPLTTELGRYFGTNEGLLIVHAPDDPEIGLEDGDVILEISGRKPTSPEHAMRILMSFEPGETLTFAIMRRERRDRVEYTIPRAGRPG